MKKKLIILMGILVIFLTSNSNIIKASENAYYTNSNGVTLNEEQYNYLINYFPENTLYSMTKEQLDMIKNDRTLSLVNETKYIKTTNAYDENGKLINSTETEVSQEEAENFKHEISPMSWRRTYQTSMKKIYMQVVSGSASTKIVTITNTWLSLPSVRSYDVIAVRPGTNSMTIHVNKNAISGYQKWDGNFVNYDADSTNTKISSSFKGKGGIGISMNIVDRVTTTLENSMTIYFLCGASTFEIYGTYQHATSDVTLAQSQNYSFGKDGYGSVLIFAKAVKNKYDNMEGIKLNYNYGEELQG